MTYRLLPAAEPSAERIPYADTWTAPKRIQRQRTKGWRMPEGAVYVGRPSRWGNPFRWKGRGRSPLAGLRQMVVVNLFRAWVTKEIDEHLTIDLAPLRGHDLACWCSLCPAHADGLPLGVTCPDCQPCHATVLLELANR